MKHRYILTILTALLLALPSALHATEFVTIESLLTEMIDRAAVARFPEPDCRWCLRRNQLRHHRADSDIFLFGFDRFSTAHNAGRAARLAPSLSLRPPFSG